jgi:hypothetical protein
METIPHFAAGFWKRSTDALIPKHFSFERA